MAQAGGRLPAAVSILALALVTRTHSAQPQPGPVYRLATFMADVTIPLNHRCMGVLPTKSQQIVDPLQARGFALLGPDQPLVLVAVDWCEIRNAAYDQWRARLAQVAGTCRERVLVCSVHQHDAPVIDSTAARLLAEVQLTNELYDEPFHQQALQRVAEALHTSLAHSVPVSHIGLGQATVDRIASNRRVVRADGSVVFWRGSNTGGNPEFQAADVGEIDPQLKTISFWSGDQPRLALHVYATHPMSHYGQGGVSWDFVGAARQRCQSDDPHVFQIYATGCSGDVTAGKYNDGAPENRAILADRLYQAMVRSWQTTRRVPLRHVAFRNAPIQFEFHPAPALTPGALERTLHAEDRSVEDRILAAMGLSSRRRVAAGQPIDLPCLDFGDALLLLFPGETFVHYQLLAQQLRPDQFVVAIGFGECWPGYIPTDAAFQEGFMDKWLWVAPGSEARLRDGLQRVLQVPH